MRLPTIGMAIGAALFLLPHTAMSASVLTSIGSCTGEDGTTRDVTGAWSVDYTGNDAPLCTTGTGTYGGDTQSAFSEGTTSISLDGDGYQRGVFRIDNRQTESFVLEATDGGGDDGFRLSVTGVLTGSYEMGVSAEGADVQADSVTEVGGTLRLNTVASQQTFREVFTLSTATAGPSASSDGIVDQILTSTATIFPGVAFVVRADAYTRGQTTVFDLSPGEGIASSLATAFASISYTFDGIPDGFCLINLSTEASSCDDNGGGGGGPTDPPTPSEVPLPATGLMLLAGLAMLRRQRKA